ncbi:MAG TPA: RsmB/NOP family class I SAM-dependent RNA methyltransferase [Burkholderiaceae bacterium]|nr:RsmB/NOP family class I SAM-dependent RNA methyltransferase [Burkholderiaceae bacterium]
MSQGRSSGKGSSGARRDRPSGTAPVRNRSSESPAPRGRSSDASAPRGRPSAAGTPGDGRARRASAGPRAVENRPSTAAIRIGQVQDALGEVLQWSLPADAALSRWLRAHPKLGARDRAEVADSVFEALRHLRRYRQFAESGSGPASRRLAILALSSVLSGPALREALSEPEKGWLDHVEGIDPAGLPRAVRASLPDWLDARLAELPDADSLITALNQTAPLDVRANPFKIERDALLDSLRGGAGLRFDPRPTPYSPWGIRLQGRPPVNRWPMFERGELEVQDEGSQILVALVAPRRGDMVIDYCAGAGGKTLLLGALMRSTGRLYAFDVSAVRLARAKPRFARSGLSNIVPVVIAPENDQRVKRLRGKAQRVLVDAPCSGLGTLRRNPDLKWRQHPDSLTQLLATQASILSQASRCVAPGGRLVYGTCSVLPEENERQVERFLAENQDFTLLDAGPVLADRCKTLTLSGPYLSLRPDHHGTDGFFGAVLERAG